MIIFRKQLSLFIFRPSVYSSGHDLPDPLFPEDTIAVELFPWRSYLTRFVVNLFTCINFIRLTAFHPMLRITNYKRLFIDILQVQFYREFGVYN